MKVCVIGTGYVGLVTGVCLAEIGHSVICVDKDESKISLLNSGKVPIYEPGLEELIKRNKEKGTIFFSSDPASGIKESEIIFICVGTPPNPSGKPDLSAVDEVARTIGSAINGYKIIVNKSTVPIGTARRIRKIIKDNMTKNNSKNCTVGVSSFSSNSSNNSNNSESSESSVNNNSSVDFNFDIVSNPEFLKEGEAVNDAFFPERLVIGAESKKAIDIMLKLYEPIINQNFEYAQNNSHKKEKVPIVITNTTSSELIKYASNAFLATKISFINEIANLCERVGANILDVSYGMGLDSRIGSRFLKAGIGWGGSCFPKDVRALCYTAEEYGAPASILNAVIQVNNQQRFRVIQKAVDLLGVIDDKVIGVLGLSFKPDTDDTREAPSITIVNKFLELGAEVRVYDPVVKKYPRDMDKGAIMASNPYKAVEGANLLILVTEWNEFKNLDYIKIKKLMKTPNIIDGRNFLDKKSLTEMGFVYRGIGI